MKENKKAILEILKKKSSKKEGKNDDKFESRGAKRITCL